MLRILIFALHPKTRTVTRTCARTPCQKAGGKKCPYVEPGFSPFPEKENHGKSRTKQEMGQRPFSRKSRKITEITEMAEDFSPLFLAFSASSIPSSRRTRICFSFGTACLSWIRGTWPTQRSSLGHITLLCSQQAVTTRVVRRVHRNLNWNGNVI